MKIPSQCPDCGADQTGYESKHIEEGIYHVETLTCGRCGAQVGEIADPVNV